MNSSHHEIFHLDAGNDNRRNTVNDAEVVTVHDGVKCISGSYQPALLIFRPEVKANGLSIIICPGGGYEKLAIEHEGTEVAQALTKLGITVFVLKYRLPNDQPAVDDMPLPLNDFITAYKTIQEKASEWKINPSSVGIMGFSAGGHLASLASSILSSPQKQEGLQNLFPPLFTILIYPVISFQVKLYETTNVIDFVYRQEAGAIVSGSAGTAQAKKEAFEAAGVKVGKTPSETAALMREVFKSL